MTQSPIPRTLSLKRVHYAIGRRKEFQRPKLHLLLKEAVNKASAVKQRRYFHPADKEPKEADACCLMSRYLTKEVGFLFELGTYVPGAAPLQLQADIDADAKEVDIQPFPITDPETGESREIVTAMSALALGDALIVESVKGFGGTSLLAKFLTYLVQTYANSDCPRIHLRDVVSRNLKDAIKAGGGVVELILDLDSIRAQEQISGRFGRQMKDLGNEIDGTELFRASFISTEDVLSDEDVIAAYSELDSDDGLDGVNLRLKDGSHLKELSRFKIKRRITVDGIQGRHPNRFQVEQEMWGFLKQLQTLNDGKRVLTEDGVFVVQQTIR